MAYWKTFSFYCSEKSFVHALMYVTIIGFIIIAICRWIRPVPDRLNIDDSDDDEEIKQQNTSSSWHRKHEITSILSSIMYVIIFLFVFCVILGGIGIALFAEFSRQSAEFGISIAIFAFCCVSMLIMLTAFSTRKYCRCMWWFCIYSIIIKSRNWSKLFILYIMECSNYCSLFTSFYWCMCSMVDGHMAMHSNMGK